MNTDHVGGASAARNLPLLACGLLLASCSLTQPQTDPTRFYVLAASGAPAVTAPAGKVPVVHLRAIELANYIKSKPMIVRRGANEIEFREFARWGEPLELGVGRVLREELLARGAAGAVLAAGLRPVDTDYDYELTVRVLACEGEADGAVNFRAMWELFAAGAKPAVVARGDFQPADLRWDGKTEAALAAQLSQAVSGLAAEIAGVLKK